MDIDAYDTLGIGLDATEEEVKKAYRRLSLQHHPDKVGQDARSKSEAEERFNEIKLARDILQDAERRKIYDTFGVDLGEERPEMEVWTIGLTTLLSPMGGFILKTALSRGALWIISFVWIGRILMLGGVCVASLYTLNVTIAGCSIRSPEMFANLVIPVGIVDAVILLQWIWPLLADCVGIFYLVSEVVGVPIIIESWKIGVGAGVGSLVVARLAQGWWFWILGLEIVLAIVMLAALTVAAGIMRLWIDGLQAQRGEALKTWRLRLREQRKRLLDEIAELKSQLQKTNSGG